MAFRNTLSAKAKVPKIAKVRKEAKTAKNEKVKDQAMDLTPPREKGEKKERTKERVSMTLKVTLLHQPTDELSQRNRGSIR